MKVLFLVQKEQRIILDAFYEAIAQNCDLDIRWLTSKEQANLHAYFKNNVQADKYDRIMLFLRFKKEIRQVAFLQTIPNLVFLEHDAYQNYINCKYQGKFSALYRKLPWVRVLSSGVSVVRRLREEGVDAHFVAKGYDESVLNNRCVERDIELGFVGSIKSATYSRRKEFLEQLAQEENLLITRTRSGEEYVQTLNRIRFFISADIGMEEYMIKNFEAMACGCVLFAYNQGEEENSALGLVDMHNVVLYRDMVELRSKLNLLRGDKKLAVKIIQNSMELVSSNFTYGALGKKVVLALEKDLRPMQQPSKLVKMKAFLGW